MTTKTKACQYCGSDDTELISIPVANYVTCHACSANGPERPTPEEAVADWNRASSTAAALGKLVQDLDTLISESEGVAGLHRNGGVAPWSGPMEGGAFDEWLRSLDDARATLTTTPAEA